MTFNRFYTHTIAILGIVSLGVLTQVPARAQIESPNIQDSLSQNYQNPQPRNNSSFDRMNNNTDRMDTDSPNRTEQEIFDVDSPSDLRDVDSQSERINPRQQPRNNSTTTSPMNSDSPSDSNSNRMNQQDSDNNSRLRLIEPHSPTDSQPGFPN